MNYKEMKIWAAEYDSQLECTDKRFKNSVLVQTNNVGSIMFYKSAFSILKDDFYIVFTEHDNFHVLHKEDYVVNMYKNIQIKNHKDISQ